MAIGGWNMTSDKARILSNPSDTSKFWRGDNSWSNTLTSILYNTRANHSDDTGFIAQNTDSTNPLKIGYIIGMSGRAGIFDYTHNEWKVEIATNGTASFNGNATTATHLSSASDSTKFYRGDKTWSNILTSRLTLDSITISNTTATEHINFSRSGGHNSPNYLNVPVSSALCISVGGAGGTNIVAMFESTGILPYSNNTKSIGTSDYKWNAMYATTFYGALSGNASSASSVAWSGVTSKPDQATRWPQWSEVTNKPVELITNTASLNSNGWKTMGGRSSGAKIAISYCSSGPATWNSGAYSSSIVFGCGDTKGLVDCLYNSPIVTFGGGSVGGSTDNDPVWYMKIKGTNGKTYTFPSDSKTLAATDGSNASGTWGISITGSSASCTGNANSANYTSHLLGVNSSNSPYGYVEGNIIRAVWNVHSDNRWYFRAGTYQCRVDYANTATTAGSCTGNAATATQLATTRSIWGQNFNGTGNIRGALTIYDGANLNFSNSNDSGDIVWWWANGNEQARFWMGSAGGTKWAPNYRCYNSSGTQLYSGCLVCSDGTGASGTWYINISGTAANLQMHETSNATAFNSLMNNNWNVAKFYTNWWDSGNSKMPYIYGSGLVIPHLDSNYRSTIYAQCNSNNVWYGWSSNQGTSYNWYHIWVQGNSVTGAVWNDYAEYRESDILPPGACVQEQDNGRLIAANRRLISGASIISDTWGFSQGETETAKTPIAVSGRVLAIPYRNRNEYHAGMAVCSAPNGTIDIMTRDEIQKYPDAIVGIVSEIPMYEEWGGGEKADRPSVKVNGRIWIKVK